MKKLLVIVFLVVSIVNFTMAQFKVKTDKFDSSRKYGMVGIACKIDRSTAFMPGEFSNGQTITYTPQFIVTKAGMMTSVYNLSFQKVEDQYYIYVEYEAWDTPNLNPLSIKSTTFLFRDGYELIIPVTTPFEYFPKYPFNEYWHWNMYSVRSRVTLEQLEIFTNKSLLSIAHNFEGVDRRYDATVEEKNSLRVVKTAIFFLTGEKASDKEVTERFSKRVVIESYANDKWDY